MQDHDNTEPAAQLSLGYRIDRTWSVEALVAASLLFERDGGLQAGRHEFNNAVGARVLASLPLNERWNLVGGVGIVQVQEDIGTDGFQNATEKKTGPMVSLAAMYRANRHWSMGVEVSSFTQSHTFNAGLRGEIHF